MNQIGEQNLLFSDNAFRTLRKFTARIAPGSTEYRIHHELGTQDVIVQSRIAGRIREGGISILDENTIQIVFGGVLNEPIDIVVVG